LVEEIIVADRVPGQERAHVKATLDIKTAAPTIIHGMMEEAVTLLPLLVLTMYVYMVAN
jgi:hypothetical protein